MPTSAVGTDDGWVGTCCSACRPDAEPADRRTSDGGSSGDLHEVTPRCRRYRRRSGGRGRGRGRGRDGGSRRRRNLGRSAIPALTGMAVVVVPQSHPGHPLEDHGLQFRGGLDVNIVGIGLDLGGCTMMLRRWDDGRPFERPPPVLLLRLDRNPLPRVANGTTAGAESPRRRIVRADTSTGRARRAGPSHCRRIRSDVDVAGGGPPDHAGGARMRGSAWGEGLLAMPPPLLLVGLHAALSRCFCSERQRKAPLVFFFWKLVSRHGSIGVGRGATRPTVWFHAIY